MTTQIEKVPSQIFRWFEKMKGNYEHSIQQVLTKFENYSSSQQVRIDNAYNENINNLKSHNNVQLSHYNEHIKSLQQDIVFYKKQLTNQQKTIDQLNTRYDAVMKCLLSGNQLSDAYFFADHEKIISEIDHEFSPELDHSTADNENFSSNNSCAHDIENDQATLYKTKLDRTNTDGAERHITDFSGSSPNASEGIFEQAIELRTNKQNDEAFELFEQAANQGHLKAMGAMGRSYFLGEGCEKNPVIGLAWLIGAANNDLPQAVKRVEQFKEEENSLYQQALSFYNQHLN